MRVAYLGPAGTYSQEALLAGVEGPVQEVPLATIHDVVMAVEDGTVTRAVVPIENSLEGSVNATLDALAFDTRSVRIVGETVLAIHHCLIGREGLALGDVEVVVSHPQALGQCAGFLRAQVAQAEIRTGTSTAEAVRTVLADGGRSAALGPRSAAERYGGSVLAAEVEDLAGNETRFAWLARADDDPTGDAGDTGGDRGGDRSERRKTAIAFWPRESDHPGWLVDCLGEFSRRGVNMTRIESRPRKVGLGEYVFFVDLEGDASEAPVAAGLDAVRAHVAQLRVLGSFAAA